MAMVHCRECGVSISETASSCPKCGAKQEGASSKKGIKKVSWTTALALSFFLGVFGADRFYFGQTGLGIAKLLTFGGFTIWWFIDLILVATKKVEGVEFE